MFVFVAAERLLWWGNVYSSFSHVNLLFSRHSSSTSALRWVGFEFGWRGFACCKLYGFEEVANNGSKKLILHRPNYPVMLRLVGFFSSSFSRKINIYNIPGSQKLKKGAYNYYRVMVSRSFFSGGGVSSNMALWKKGIISNTHKKSYGLYRRYHSHFLGEWC